VVTWALFIRLQMELEQRIAWKWLRRHHQVIFHNLL
jgi:hypothetical protein